MSHLEIEILVFAGCPNAPEARRNIEEAVRQEDRSADIVRIQVDTQALAAAHRFLGSPSIRINGYDVERGADARRDYGLMCRTYRNGETIAGAPPVEMIRAAIRALLVRRLTQ